MLKTITFDMDGTLADFYGVHDWLDKIRAYDVSPYKEAKPLINMNVLARRLNRLQKKGYILRIVTWGSKESTYSFDKKTKEAKLWWLHQHLPSVHWDEFVFCAYGTEKSLVGTYPSDILFDDSTTVRSTWVGDAYPETEIMPVLKSLA